MTHLIGQKRSSPLPTDPLGHKLHEQKARRAEAVACCQGRATIATTEHADGQAQGTGPISLRLDGQTFAETRQEQPVIVAGTRCLVRVARSVEQVESLRTAWVSMARDGVQTDLDYFLWSLEEEPHVVRPHVVAVERDGRIEAILSARVLDAPFPCKLGYSTVYAPKVRAICVMRHGLLGRADPETVRVVLDELMSGLEQREADAVLFRQLERDSALHAAARARSTFATWQHASQVDLRWRIDLPPTFDEYVSTLSSSTRKGVRRTRSRLEQKYGDRLSTRIFKEPAVLDGFLADAESVALKTYQRRLGVGFQGVPDQRARTSMLMERGWFTGYILYLDGTPIAFEQGEVYGGRFHSLSAGYDPSYGQDRVGAHLLMTAIEDLIGDPAVSVFDFGFGDADYKRRLGHRSVQEVDAIVYARQLRPIWVNVARSVVLQTSSATKAGLRRVALLDSSKRWWRRSRSPTS